LDTLVRIEEGKGISDTVIVGRIKGSNLNTVVSSTNKSYRVGLSFCRTGLKDTWLRGIGRLSLLGAGLKSAAG